MNLILFGFKGVGKTHYGKLLAKELKYPFIDTDDFFNDSPRKLYEELGETAFRALEKKELKRLGDISHSVIALGGGVVLDPENVEFLQNLGTLVYLDASFKTIEARIKITPAFVKPGQSLRDVYHERKPIYDSISAARIDIDLFDEPGVLAALKSLVIDFDRS
jgi:shikimate kinase